METPDDSPSNAELVDRYVVDHDSEALGQLLERHAPTAYRAVLRLMAGSSADAQDAVQAGFVDIMKTIHTLKSRDDRAIKAWILKVVMNTSKSWIRGDVRRKQREERAAADEETLQPAHSPDDVRTTEVAGVVKQYIERLAEHYRLPLWLHHGEGLSFPEVAEALSLPEGTVRSQVKRGLDMLKDSLSRLGYSVPAVGLIAALQAQPAEAVPPAVLAGIKNLAIGGLPATTSSATAAGVSILTAKIVIPTLLASAVLVAGVGIYLSINPTPPEPAQAPVLPAPAQVTPPPVLRASISAPISTRSIGGTIQDVAWDGTSLWVSGGNPPHVVRIDPGNGRVLRRLKPQGLFVGGPLAWDGQTLWLSGAWTNGSVQNQSFEFKALDRESGAIGEVLGLSTTRHKPLAFSAESLWTLERATHAAHLVRRDRKTGQTTRTLRLADGLLHSSQVQYIACTPAAIWLTELLPNPVIHRLDPVDGHAILSLQGPWQWPTGLASDGRNTLWLISHHDSTIYRIDVGAAALHKAQPAPSAQP